MLSEVQKGKITFSRMIVNQRDTISLCVCVGGKLSECFQKERNVLPSFSLQQDQPSPFGLTLSFVLSLAHILAGI